MDDDTELTSPNVSPDDEQRAAEAPAIKEDGDRSAFDPTPYMRQLRGRGGSQDYLDVKWRLLWLRREHPDAQIITEHVTIDDDSAIFKATVSVPSGGRATGYGSETVGDFGDFIEKAETKAIGRALNALGYGAQFAEGDEEGGPAAARPIPANRPRRPAKAPDPAPIPMNTVSTPVAVPSGPPPASEAPPREMTRSAPAQAETGSEAMDDGVETTGAIESEASPSIEAESPPEEEQEEEQEPEPEMADYSHSAFWAWARPRGYQTREDVERAIGRSMKGQTPKEVRRMLIDVGAEP